MFVFCKEEHPSQLKKLIRHCHVSSVKLPGKTLGDFLAITYIDFLAITFIDFLAIT
jgi:hypothetical protein